MILIKNLFFFYLRLLFLIEFDIELWICGLLLIISFNLIKVLIILNKKKFFFYFILINIIILLLLKLKNI